MERKKVLILSSVLIVLLLVVGFTLFPKKESLTVSDSSQGIIPGVTAQTTGYGWGHLGEVNCTDYTDTPEISGWNESFDSGNRTFYCMFNESVFYVGHEIARDGGNNWSVGNPADLWTNNFLLSEKGNVRNVEIEIDYYEPSIFGSCLSHTKFKNRDEYSVKQHILIANHNNGFHEETTFDDAFILLNDYMLDLPCDQWNTLQVVVSDFGNDHGASFTGNSKQLGSLGFEINNLFISRVEVIGTEETITLW